jgi:hypothetical protein
MKGAGGLSRTLPAPLPAAERAVDLLAGAAGRRHAEAPLRIGDGRAGDLADLPVRLADVIAVRQ